MGKPNPAASLVRKIWSRLGIISIKKKIHGEPVLLPVLGYGLRGLIFPEPWSNYEGDFFLRFLSFVKPGSVVFDIGAFRGLYSLFAARRSQPNGLVVAFEPNPFSFEIMQETLSLNGIDNVRLESFALSDKPGVSKLLVRGSESGESFVLSDKLGVSKHLVGGLESVTSLHESQDDVSYGKQLSVSMTTVDQFVTNTGLSPDLLKIDVEGFELKVLIGAQNALHDGVTVFCEIHPEKLLLAGNSESELFHFMNSIGYHPTYKSVRTDEKSGKPFHVVFEKIKVS